MRIDRTHRHWLWFCIAVVALSTAVYVPYARNSTPGGGTPTGIAFGVVALALMIFAALLSVRKRLTIWRIGRTRLWMKAHLWLGFLALPMVLFHAAFHAFGTLTGILLWLTVIVVGSGIWGAWLQHTLPSKMFREVPYETIYDQIDVIRAQLVEEASRHVANVTESLAPGRGAGATVVLTLLAVPELGAEVGAFDRFYTGDVLRFLTADRGEARKMNLHDRKTSGQEFENYRRLLPPQAWESITAIEDVCEEKRQLDEQVRLHRWLHSWLLVHLPLSAALLLLACIHAVVAMRY
jgi:hypothetical protein